MTFNLQEELNKAATDHFLEPTTLQAAYEKQFMLMTEEVRFPDASPEIPKDEQQRRIYAFQRAVQLEVSHQTRLISIEYTDAFFMGYQSKQERLRQAILACPENVQADISGNLEGKRDWLTGKPVTDNTHGLSMGNANSIDLPRLSLQVGADFKIYHPIMDVPEEFALYQQLYKERTVALEALNRAHRRQIGGRTGTSSRELWAQTLSTNPALKELEVSWRAQNKGYNFPTVTELRERKNYDQNRRAAPDAAADPEDFRPA